MRNKVVKMILNAFLSVLPLLFLYGVVVNSDVLSRNHIQLDHVIHNDDLQRGFAFTCSFTIFVPGTRNELRKKDNRYNDTWNLWIGFGYSCWFISFGLQWIGLLFVSEKETGSMYDDICGCDDCFL